MYESKDFTLTISRCTSIFLLWYAEIISYQYAFDIRANFDITSDWLNGTFSFTSCDWLNLR